MKANMFLSTSSLAAIVAFAIGGADLGMLRRNLRRGGKRG